MSDLARHVGLQRATARRALLTLVALGYVDQDDKAFRLTPRVLRLATAYLTSNLVSTLLQPACDRVAVRLGGSCTAAVVEADEVVTVARALPAQLVPAGAGIGYRQPACCTALGRVLLAALPDDVVGAYLDRVPLQAVTRHTSRPGGGRNFRQPCLTRRAWQWALHRTVWLARTPDRAD